MESPASRGSFVRPDTPGGGYGVAPGGKPANIFATAASISALIISGVRGTVSSAVALHTAAAAA